MIKERKIIINTIPTIMIGDDNSNRGLVIFYHGWTSNKDLQSIRGRILASYGYRVLMPDCAHHGERGFLDYDAPETYPLFWQIIMQNIEEGQCLLDYANTNWGVEPTAVMGHSMGGITAVGLLGAYTQIQLAISLNGSGWWAETNHLMKENLDIKGNGILAEVELKIAAQDPLNHPERFIGRSLLALNGGADDVVSPLAQTIFIRQLQQIGVDAKQILYPKLGHFLTTNMMGEAVQWLEHKLHK